MPGVVLRAPFGFVVGFGPRFNYDVGGWQQETLSAAVTPPEPRPLLLVWLVVAAVIVAFVILKCVSTARRSRA